MPKRVVSAVSEVSKQRELCGRDPHTHTQKVHVRIQTHKELTLSPPEFILPVLIPPMNDLSKSLSEPETSV